MHLACFCISNQLRIHISSIHTCVRHTFTYYIHKWRVKFKMSALCRRVRWKCCAALYYFLFISFCVDGVLFSRLFFSFHFFSPSSSFAFSTRRRRRGVRARESWRASMSTLVALWSRRLCCALRLRLVRLLFCVRLRLPHGGELSHDLLTKKKEDGGRKGKVLFQKSNKPEEQRE